MTDLGTYDLSGHDERVRLCLNMPDKTGRQTIIGLVLRFYGRGAATALVQALRDIGEKPKEFIDSRASFLAMREKLR